jgi:hypothetical protein
LEERVASLLAFRRLGAAENSHSGNAEVEDCRPLYRSEDS